MKVVCLWMLLVGATTFIPLAAHADYFELKLKATCFDPSTSKFTVQKEKLANDALIAKVLNIAPEEAAAFTFT